jgi:hypothetical protein
VLGSPAVPGAVLLATRSDGGVTTGGVTGVAGVTAVVGVVTGATFLSVAGAGVWQATTVQTEAMARTSRGRVRMAAIISEPVMTRIVVTLTSALR